MGIRILRLRHKTAPVVLGCRWCGFPKRDHPICLGASQEWRHPRTPHCWTEPTQAQRTARVNAPPVFTMSDFSATEVANGARTRL